MTAASPDSLERIKGISTKTREYLAELGVHTFSDLLFLLPNRFEDKGRICSVPEGAADGSRSTFIGKILSVQHNPGRMPELSIKLVDDRSGAEYSIPYFKAYPTTVRMYQNSAGMHAAVYSQAQLTRWGYQLAQPAPGDVQIIESPQDFIPASRLSPVYPGTLKLKPAQVAKLALKAIAAVKADPLEELMPLDHPRCAGIGIMQAIEYSHYPERGLDPLILEHRLSPANIRLKFEELTAFTLSVRLAGQKLRAAASPGLQSSGRLAKQLTGRLSFSPTGAQLRVAEEIRQDLGKKVPMMRLLQGDVGSGKTLVAALSALDAAEAGYQTALMAPTEILAEQHRTKLTALLEPIGIKTAFLSGKQKTKERRAELDKIASGEALIVIGTHALFSDDVAFKNLGYVIIDEQHRFGVEQRLMLQKKAADGMQPHQLIMTATPIPRTLAMTNYADLDLSVLDELPPGRIPTQTCICSDRGKLIERIRLRCKDDGWQAYWVCPLIEESEKLGDVADAENAFKELQEAMPDVAIGLVHGRMSSDEKNDVIGKYKEGSLSVLVATTVIEVGVDVPNASIMVLENPERLGLAQLHQLRGRVGRGRQQSYCMLLVDSGKGPSERLKYFKSTTDGLAIAEYDLNLRGSGEYLGTRQTGTAKMKIADLAQDSELCQEAADLAEKMAVQDPEKARRLAARWFGNDTELARA